MLRLISVLYFLHFCAVQINASMADVSTIPGSLNNTTSISPNCKFYEFRSFFVICEQFNEDIGREVDENIEVRTE